MKKQKSPLLHFKKYDQQGRKSFFKKKKALQQNLWVHMLDKALNPLKLFRNVS